MGVNVAVYPTGQIVKSPAIFLDRDGTLIRDVGYLRHIEQIELLPGVVEAIRLLSQRGFKLVVITNQSGIARGLFSELEVGEIHKQLSRMLAERDANLDGIYYCPHHPTAGEGVYSMLCDCRKPNTALVERASAELALDLSRSYVVGDQLVDMELANRVGVPGIWIKDQSVHNDKMRSASHLASNLWEAAQWIVDQLEN
jgi:D-glycero-D-manno-heptose 1,7-bisphosphate phosphatase